MGFMDSVSAFTKGVGAKAKGNYDVVTMNAQLSAAKKEINELYMKLGEEYYKEHATSPEDFAAEYVEQINAKLNSIEELNKQIEIKKAETASVQLVATGTADGQQANTLGRTCKQCGAVLADGDLFCPECGTKNEIEEVVSTNEKETETEEKQSDAQKICCPTCGTEVAEGDLFCPECGTKLG